MNQGESGSLLQPVGEAASAKSSAVVPIDTFRLPSTSLFLGLMPVFSGLARRSDLAAVLSHQSDQQRQSQVRTYIVYSGRESQARTSLSLFEDDPLWNEGELSSLIKRQFGPTGLKHLLGVFIAAEENSSNNPGQPGSFVFDASRHLDILGYSRSNRVNGKGYHSTKHLQEAREIVTLLCSLTIVQEIRLGSRRGTTLKIRLLQDEASAQSWEETIADGGALKQRINTNEKIFLRFNPHLFNASVKGNLQMRYQYTLQLKKLARENARSQGLTLTLGAHLPIKFRMNNCGPLRLSARAFLRMAGIVEEDYTCYEHLERLETTLRYMVEQGYISRFETGRYVYTASPAPIPEPKVKKNVKGARRRTPAQLELKTPGDPFRIEAPEPLEEVWQVDPPRFLHELLKTAPHAAQSLQSDLRELARTSVPSGPRAATAMLPGMESEKPLPEAAVLLRRVRKSLSLQQSQLAQRLGVTQAAVSMAESGKRPGMAERLLEAARRLT